MPRFCEGACPSCGRVWRRPHPHDLVVCDCYRYCPVCGAEMEPYGSDAGPKIYRSEEAYDPTGSAERDEADTHTRLKCPRCGHLSDGVPVEVELS